MERAGWQVGKMDVNVSKAMFAEHTMSEDSTEEFFAPNTQLSTTPLEEWRFVVGIDGGVNAAGEIVEGGRPGNEALVEGRNAHSLKHLVGLKEAVEAKLTLAELVALRLYTGPMVWTSPHPCLAPVLSAWCIASSELLLFLLIFDVEGGLVPSLA
jgi:hypothetical protein